MLQPWSASFSLALVLCLLSCGHQRRPAGKVPKEALSPDFDEQPPFTYGMPDRLTATSVSPGWGRDGQPIILTGTVYGPDGESPAANTLLYYYHTNTEGVYATREDEPTNMPRNALGQTHGYLRGWVKTESDGRYTIKTVLPGRYPGRQTPAHIHVTLRDEYMNDPYYVDDFVFDSDPQLTTEVRKTLENRGGSGIIRFVRQGELLVGERNLYLGLHIPDYPVAAVAEKPSGRAVGEDIFSFTPRHAYGPDKGTTTCPICKYGWYNGILYFVGNHPDWQEIETWLLFLDRESARRQGRLTVYFVYGNENDYEEAKRMSILEELGERLHLRNTALTFVPSFADERSEIYLNEISQDVGNTFLLYRRSTIIGKYVELAPTEANFTKLRRRLDAAENEYFLLPRAKWR